jgi:hypothetical protein
MVYLLPHFGKAIIAFEEKRRGAVKRSRFGAVAMGDAL